MRSLSWLVAAGGLLSACLAPTTPGPTGDSGSSNHPPGEALLAAPAEGAPNQPLTVLLEWSAATDPDGDAVTYELRFDAGDMPTTVVASGLTETSLELTDLTPTTAYAWQVVATDARGAETVGAVHHFTTQDIVTAVLQTKAPWTGRSGFGAVVFDGKMWVLGGQGCCGGFFSDVWSSPDGVTWTEELDDAPWGPRGSHTATVHDGRMWIVGGYETGSTDHADVWSSTDGVSWVQEAKSPLPPHHGAELAVLGDRMWLVGGRGPGGVRYQVNLWSSADGVTWTDEKNEDGTGRDTSGELLSHDGALWYIGGYRAWATSSPDGLTWTRHTETAPFGDRITHSCASHDGRLWLISGSIADSGAELADVWYSDDGVTWVLASDDAGFTPVAYARALSFQGKLWLLGGGGGFGDPFVTSDVYTLE